MAEGGMELGQLRTFLRVAELGSLSRAATALRIAQPALSRQIRLLEAELGVRLFERHGRGMVLSERGRDLLGHAGQIVNGVAELRAEAAERAAALSGRVAIGLPPTMCDLIAVPLVSALRAAHPALELRLVSGFTGHLLDWLHRGEIELAVLYDPQPSRALRARPLLEEALHLIGPAGSGLSIGRAVPFAELAGERLLLPSHGHGLRRIVESCAATAGVRLSVPVEADSFATLRDLVQAGHGRTVLPLAALRGEIAAGRLCAAPLTEPVPRRVLVLGFAAARPAGRAARAAAALITSVVERLVSDGAWQASLGADGASEK
jgi:LysR family nitrogen assimilation transcriptional regulator